MCYELLALPGPIDHYLIEMRSAELLCLDHQVPEGLVLEEDLHLEEVSLLRG